MRTRPVPAEPPMRHRTYMMALLALAGGCCRVTDPLAAPTTRPAEPFDEHRRVTMADGVGIDLWLFHGRSPATAPSRPGRPGTVVVLHGMLENKTYYLWLAKALVPLGYDVVLMDMRAHGDSGGTRSTFGALEKHDVKAVVDAALASGLHTPLYAWGISMGASTAIQYAAIDPRCRGVVAVTPYRDFPSVATRLLPGVGDLIPLLGRFKPSETSTLLAARKLTVPLIVIHGRDDTVIPWTHGRDVSEAAAGPTRFFLVPDAGHATILSGRDDWMVKQILSLPGMSTPRP